MSGEILCKASLTYETNIGVMDGINHLLLGFLGMWYDTKISKNPPKLNLLFDTNAYNLMEPRYIFRPFKQMLWVLGE